MFTVLFRLHRQRLRITQTMRKAFLFVLFYCSLTWYPSHSLSTDEEVAKLRHQSENCIVPEKLPGASAFAGGLCQDPEPVQNEMSRTDAPRSEDIVDFSKLPKDFFWGNIHGVNYLTVSRNQHIPQYCGSCWAFGTTSEVSDRIKILRRNAFPEINLAPQVLINCRGGGTCGGGFVAGVYRYLMLVGLPDETCQNYLARNSECLPNGFCTKCSPVQTNFKSQCKPVQNATRYYISDYGSASSELSGRGNALSNSKQIQAEIYARGPVSCTIYATQKLDDYTGGIFSQLGFWITANHVVSLVGWGEEEGVKYWIGRNSWGTYWGENGFFRIRRDSFFFGLGVENSCTFSAPIIPEHLLPRDPLPKYVPYGEFLLKYHAPKEEEPSAEETAVFYEEESLEEITNKKTIPVDYDIRNISGINYASINRNQNNPLYCESSWAQTATSALNDRFALLKKGSYPEVVLSVQVLLNCVKKEKDGCKGGSPENAYAYIKKHTIPDESCAPYEAKLEKCSPIQICKSCWPSGCYAMESGEYTPYTISDYGKVSGDEAVQKEIAANGPVACKICDSEAFLSYKGGILKDKGNCKTSKSYVVLAGWGIDNGVKYWIGRNSWGTYWGEDGGWFRIAMGYKDLGITKDCYWAKPVIPEYKHLYTTSSIDLVKQQLGFKTLPTETRILI